jgi:hypothetical protein
MPYTVTYTNSTTIIRSQFPEGADQAMIIAYSSGGGSTNLFGSKVSVLLSNLNNYTGNLQINVGNTATKSSDVRINNFGNLCHERIIVAGAASNLGTVLTGGNTTGCGGYISYNGTAITNNTTFSAQGLLSFSGLFSPGFDLGAPTVYSYNGQPGSNDGSSIGGRGGHGRSGAFGGGAGGGGGGGGAGSGDFGGEGGTPGSGGSGGNNGSNGANGTNGAMGLVSDGTVLNLGGPGGNAGLGVLLGGLGGLAGNTTFKGGDGWCGGGGGGAQGTITSSPEQVGGCGGGSSFVMTSYTITGSITNTITTSSITFERGTEQTSGNVTIIWYINEFVDIYSTAIWNSYVGNTSSLSYNLMNDIIFNNNFGGNLYLKENSVFDGRENTIYIKNVNNLTGLFNIINGDSNTRIRDLTLYCYNCSLADYNSFLIEGGISSRTGNCIINNCKIILKNTTIGNACSGFVSGCSGNIQINNSYITGFLQSNGSGAIIGTKVSNVFIYNSYSVGEMPYNNTGRICGNINTIDVIRDTYSVGLGISPLFLSNSSVQNNRNTYIAYLDELL